MGVTIHEEVPVYLYSVDPEVFLREQLNQSKDAFDEEVVLDKLSLADGQLVSTHWPYTEDPNFVLSCVEHNLSTCVRVKGEAVQWQVMQNDGSIGTLSLSLSLSLSLF